ncbi:MAG: acyl-CoA thioesterase [Crocinitomicaceae bacterium]|nr:acyl-CoA thioesterase [Crocinitomicaceae bacterium]
MKIEPAKIQVRFSDVDALGHVNNAVYLNYFEFARIHYFNAMLGTEWDWDSDGLILLKNEVQYLKPLLLNDNPEVRVYVTAIGNKSFTMSYDLTVNGILYCKGSSVLVGYDNKEKCSIELSPTMRLSLERLKAEQ